jgi:uncharacterized protein (DUF1330 family)
MGWRAERLAGKSTLNRLGCASAAAPVLSTAAPPGWVVFGGGLPTVREKPEEGRLAAYVIASIKVKDPERYPEYARQTPAVVERHGGRFLAKGGRYEELEGSWPGRRLVIIEFPDMETARRWYGSREYQELAALRQRYADGDIVLVEGA